MIDALIAAGRVVQRHRPGAWIGAIRRAFGPMAQADGDESGIVESLPPHELIALWRPLRLGEALLPRWPRKAMLVAPDLTAAFAELLRDVPEHEVLWLPQHEFDWGLIAEIVMQSDSQLAPYQRHGLEQFAHREQAATCAAIRRNYRSSQSAAGQYRDSAAGLLG